MFIKRIQRLLQQFHFLPFKLSLIRFKTARNNSMTPTLSVMKKVVYIIYELYFPINEFSFHNLMIRIIHSPFSIPQSIPIFPFIPAPRKLKQVTPIPMLLMSLPFPIIYITSLYIYHFTNTMLLSVFPFS